MDDVYLYIAGDNNAGDKFSTFIVCNLFSIPTTPAP